VFLYNIDDRILAKILKNAFFNRKISIFLPMDPDSQYGSGYTMSLNPDPIRIRIRNPAKCKSCNAYFMMLEGGGV
jgi:hypothetical protein